MSGNRLEGKVAIVTGGSRGQGEAECRLFVSEGARVVIADVLADEGEALAKELGDAAVFQRTDVTSPSDWAALVGLARERFGAVDVLVNNAAVLRTKSIEDMTLDEYRAVVDINQVGTWLGMKSVLPAMRDAGGGSIVNISSIGGLQGIPGMSAYVATKFAVRGMTKVAAIEFGRYGIRVNSVHPGTIRTPMIDNPSMRHIDFDEGFTHLPVPRAGVPEDVATLVLFLASDESSYCSGSEFVVDGGSTSGTIPRG